VLRTTKTITRPRRHTHARWLSEPGIRFFPQTSPVNPEPRLGNEAIALPNAEDSRSIDLQRILRIQFGGEKIECANFLTGVEEQVTKWINFSQSRNLFFDAFDRFDNAETLEKVLPHHPKMSAANCRRGNVGEKCRRRRYSRAKTRIPIKINPEKTKRLQKIYRGGGAAGVSSGTSCLSRMVYCDPRHSMRL
jgi:hypothetical protein